MFLMDIKIPEINHSGRIIKGINCCNEGYIKVATYKNKPSPSEKITKAI